ncbi:MAG: AbrB/MazE/SpoVT family DNA-binding domain-containing protein [Leptospiraceae bacterium]|nr:AbrB/MazE/SpoVT family DNA-binding domain-containing protein [Leptospiraceae bacterium]
MTKKLIQYENDIAIVIEKAILDSLKIDLNTQLEIKTDGKSIIIFPINQNSIINKLKNSLKKINKKHGKTLKKLAE